METSLSHTLLIAVAVGLASGAIGSFIILRRMALVGDALSHVALPGIALALAWSIDPFWGVVVFLAVAAVVVWWLQGKTKLPGEAIVGLLFTASLAVGILALPSEDLIDSLFGAFPALSSLGLWLIVLGAVLLTAATFWLARKFLFMIVSPDLAHVNGISSKADLAILLIFALVVALGIKLVGTLLMGALTIIPALIAKNICRSMRAYVLLSSVLGALTAAAGVLIASRFGLYPGPTIVLLGVAAFVCSLFFSKQLSGKSA